MSIIKEFQKFAQRGNVIDMAVGVIIGGAFGKIVSSAVNDLIMPPMGLMVGLADFSKLKLVIRAAVLDEAGNPVKPEAAITYGNFLQNCMDFLILAFAIFMMVRFINSLKKKEEEAPTPAPIPPRQEVLLEEIRDLLKKN